MVLINLPRCSISCMYFFLPEKCSLSATGSNKVSTTILWIPSLISLYRFAMTPLCMGDLGFVVDNVSNLTIITVVNVRANQERDTPE